MLCCSWLCRYNNKTYRVDDIDWERNPTFQFEANVRVNGPDRRETERKVVSMIQYYQQVRHMYTLSVYTAQGRCALIKFALNDNSGRDRVRKQRVKVMVDLHIPDMRQLYECVCGIS